MSKSRHPDLLPVLLVLMLGVTAAAPRAIGQEIDTVSTRYVHRLMDRRLYGLAESVCLDRLARAGTPSAKAQWVLTITDCWQHRSWNEESTSRRSLLKHAAGRITEFLDGLVVPPVLELRLRLQQGRCLNLMFQQDVLIRNGGRMHCEPESGVDLSIPAQVQELVEALLQQIEQIRRDLDPLSVRVVRNEARLLLADSQLMQARFETDERIARQHLDDVEKLAEIIQRASIDATSPFTARAIQVQVLRLRGQSDAARLRLDALGTHAVDSKQRFEALLLNVDNLLSKQRAAEATTRLAAWKQEDLLVLPAVQYLRAAAALTEFELVDQLSQPVLRATSSAAAQASINEALSSPAGVWHEASENVAARFRSVDRLGVIVADLLEDVETLSAAGKIDQATARLDTVLQSLPPALPPASIGMVLARRAELSVSSGDYDSAIQLLAQAEPMLKGTSQAAPADLLRCYCLGQLWQRHAEDEDRRSRYEAAVVGHVDSFAGEPSIQDAREWLILLWRNTRPVDAARQLLALAAEADSDRVEVTRLLEAGDLLLRRVIEESELNQAESEVLSELKATFRTYVADTAHAHKATAVVAASLAILETIISSSDSDPMLTQSHQLQVADEFLRSFVAAADEDADSDAAEYNSALQSLGWQCVAARLVAAADNPSDPTTIDAYVRRMRQTPVANRQLSARMLARAIRSRNRSPRANALIATAIPEVLPAEEATPGGFPEKVRRVRIIAAAARVSGDVKSLESALTSVIGLAKTKDDILEIAGLFQASHSAATPFSPVSSQLVEFWRRVRTESRSGSPMWFEASLQLASAELRNGNRDRALKIVALVEIVGPDWGDSDRLDRATQLKARLNEGGR